MNVLCMKYRTISFAHLCAIGKKKSPHIKHLENGGHFDHNCTSSMMNLSKKSIINKNRAQEANDKIDKLMSLKKCPKEK